MNGEPLRAGELHSDQALEKALKQYRDMQHELSIFMEGVAKWFSNHPEMTGSTPPIVHSVKFRLKNADHLSEKIKRKFLSNGALSFRPEKLGDVVTDLAGVRVLHLHQTQFQQIHDLLDAKIKSGDWSEAEAPKAYTWDPESKEFFESLGLNCELKDSFYTSVHYVLRPKPGSQIACEVQIRTLFEEIWGEVDHSLNYPSPTEKAACREQLRVLAKVVGAGSRLVDSIFRT